MVYVSIRELKNGASEVIRAVREEQARYVVTLHGRPVAIHRNRPDHRAPGNFAPPAADR